jgi:hypothetical protein
MTEIRLQGTFKEDNTPWGLDAWEANGRFNVVASSDDEESGYGGAELDAEQVSQLVAAGLEFLAKYRHGEYETPS